MYTSSTTTVQPNVLSDFNAMSRAGFIGTTSNVLIAVIRPVFAKMSDVFGHFQALLLAMVFEVLGSLICSFSNNFSTIFGGTSISVLGQAGYKTLVAIILAEILPIHMRASVAAYVSVPNIVNYYLGVEVGNSLIDRWQWVYGILAILAVACAMPALCSLYIQDRRARAVLNSISELKAENNRSPILKRINNALVDLDIFGLVLISGGLLALLAPLGMELNIMYGWGSVQFIAPLCIGALVLTIFVYYERFVAKFPLVPFRLFKSRTFTCAIIANIFFNYSSKISLYYFNPYTQVTSEVSSRTAMFLQLGATGFYIGMFLGGLAMQYSKRYRRWSWIGWALWLVNICIMVHSRGGKANGVAITEIAIVQLLQGIGDGIVTCCVGIGIQASVSTVDLPIAITLYSMVACLGNVLGEATATTVWVNTLPSKLKGHMRMDVDIDSAINNINYFLGLPVDQRAIVQDAYVSTQKNITFCCIVSMLIAGIAMSGLVPHDLSEISADNEPVNKENVLDQKDSSADISLDFVEKLQK
ncbi:hypothetical protein BX661DRAFT_187395 [Kickxella alabastrina]|uniref:uncharacterized protein n=1 Tax=Kickxella alabastrina TaxID=61397 RepID=UPI002220C1F5|nr:uncharacterized protein BX661DRAFT_187395 [Kickxella alabastrina]KAI7822436.1 hypothetical protein BX661DRAFT_187395 [Kickxella alabastrina]